MNRLFDVPKMYDLDEIEKILNESTIFDKIEFSGITKEAIRNKINDLETRQVPQRQVLLDCSDDKVTEYWFKNWLHPQLKHAVKPAPRDKSGCCKKVIEEDNRRDFLRFYENGQHKFNYTLDDIKQWLKENSNEIN